MFGSKTKAAFLKICRKFGYFSLNHCILLTLHVVRDNHYCKLKIAMRLEISYRPEFGSFRLNVGS